MASDRNFTGYNHYFLLAVTGIAFCGAGFLFAKALFVPAGLSLLTGLITASILMRFNQRTNDSIALFFDSLRNGDTAIQFPPSFNSRSMDALFESMNRLNRHFQEIRFLHESNENFYRSLIRHSATGMVLLNQNNGIELMNEMACRYAGISPESTNYKVLEIKNPEFYRAICAMVPGENVTYRNVINNSFQLLFFRATLIRKEDQPVKFISIQDIRQELESKEVESYRKLIRVLTHEIMNLLSPITSVSKALYAQYHLNDKPVALANVNENFIQTTVMGLQVIEEQSRGITDFVNNYRRISRIPAPVIEAFSVRDWLEQIKIVFTNQFESGQIHFEIMADNAVRQILADKNLINQVAINVMNNAMDAVMENEGSRRISLQVLLNFQKRILIKISNNGPCIPPELQEKIFVPFFTTKKNGSGIGLSISQEIMKLHKGSIQVFSEPGGHTVFVLEI
jgi:two-component system, NtrC family, nitrogen regulation sensor histidine kinase NtrY